MSAQDEQYSMKLKRRNVLQVSVKTLVNTAGVEVLSTSPVNCGSIR
jgi:hypothetical protein